MKACNKLDEWKLECLTGLKALHITLPFDFSPNFGILKVSSNSNFA